MTVADYQPFVERMIERYEGGYGWDRRDPGGPTKYGITCFDLAEHRHETMDSMAKWAPLVKAMPLSEADDIYAQKYATACAFNALDIGKDCVVFDFGVNSGPSRSIKCAQQVCGNLVVDGELGPLTLAAINAHDATDFIGQLCATRLRFLQGLDTWNTFGTGWTARVIDLRQYSLRLVSPPNKGQTRIFDQRLTRIPKAFAKGWAKPG